LRSDGIDVEGGHGPPMLAGRPRRIAASLTTQRARRYDLGTVPGTTTRALRETTPIATAESGTGPLTARDARLAPWRAFVTAQAHVSRRLDEDLRAEHGLSRRPPSAASGWAASRTP
jgi:hypothetical protein